MAEVVKFSFTLLCEDFITSPTPFLVLLIISTPLPLLHSYVMIEIFTERIKSSLQLRIPLRQCLESLLEHLNFVRVPPLPLLSP